MNARELDVAYALSRSNRWLLSQMTICAHGFRNTTYYERDSSTGQHPTELLLPWRKSELGSWTPWRDLLLLTITAT